MHLRIGIHARYLALFTALGLPVACDSVTESDIPCSDSTANLVQDQVTGYETCTEGQRHRPALVTCPNGLPRSATCEPANMEFPGNCTSDADCTDQPYGTCGVQGQTGECGCSYGCVADSDCGEGRICDCGDPVGRCVTADCTTDDDCEGALLCVAYVTDPGCGGTGFTCQTSDDLCASDVDCEAGQSCAKGDGRLECVEAACAIGRPFLVHGSARTAPFVGRADWLEVGLTPSVVPSDSHVREALAAHWRDVGAMEHASIAAFARFALQLMSQGAPASLLSETHAAMEDETRHARAAFAFASAYAGEPVGPGPLEVDDATLSGDARAILRNVVLEGCVGETIAAAEAAEAALCATDLEIKRALTAIAEDEQRHAELAWRYVAWAIERDPELTDTLLGALASAKQERVEDADDELLAYGVLGGARRRHLRDRVLAEIVVPAGMAIAAQRAAA